MAKLKICVWVGEGSDMISGIYFKNTLKTKTIKDKYRNIDNILNHIPKSLKVLFIFLVRKMRLFPAISFFFFSL